MEPNQSDLLSTPTPDSTADPTLRARRPDMLTAAATVLGVESCLLVLLGLQSTMLMRWRPPYDKALYALGVLGAITAVVAFRVARVEPRTQRLAIGYSAVLAVLLAGWTVFGFLSGVISLLSVFTVLGAISATLLLNESLPACRDSYAAREQLRAEGVEFNL